VDVFHSEFTWVLPNRKHAPVVSPIDKDTTETIDVGLVVSLTPLPDNALNDHVA